MLKCEVYDFKKCWLLEYYLLKIVENKVSFLLLILY